jgi:MFS family permease
MLGAPLGGILYTKFGFRGPFIFGCLLAVFDIVGRLLVIERKDAIRWLPPTPILESPHNCTHFGEPAVEDHELASIPSVSSGSTDPTRSFILEADVEPMPRLSFVQALRNLSTSPRALSLMFCVFAVQ